MKALQCSVVIYLLIFGLIGGAYAVEATSSAMSGVVRKVVVENIGTKGVPLNKAEPGAPAKPTESTSSDLASLMIAPSMQFITKDGEAGNLSIEGFGNYYFHEDATQKSGIQINLSARSTPDGDRKSDLAHAVRTNIGTFSLNVGATYSLLFDESTSWGNGPVGLELKIAAPLSYQSTPEASGDGDAAESTKQEDFAIFSPEAKVGLWLKYALIGYKCNYFITSDNSNKKSVSSALNESFGHKIYVFVKVDALSGDTEDRGNQSPFYIEASYTGDKDTLDNGKFAIELTKVLGW